MNINKPKVVYVTGCLGFIGSYITETCLKLGWQVRGIDKCTYAARLDLLDTFNLYPNFIFEKIDINDIPFLYDCDYVINTAAESHVANSIVCSDEFIHSNVNGVHHLLELIKNGREEIKPNLVHFSCYDSKTRALTTDGLKDYKDIKINDTVISINGHGTIEFKRVTRVIKQRYTGKMIHFRNISNDLLVTPNHRMYYMFDNNIKHKEAKDIYYELKNGGYKKYHYPHGIYNGLKDKTINIPGIGSVDTKALFYVCGIFIGDGFTALQRKKSKNKSGFIRSEYLERARDPKTNRFCKIIDTGNIEYSYSDTHRIFFDVPESDKGRKLLEENLYKLNIKYTAHKNKSGEHIYFSSKEWLEFFTQFGKYAKNKTIPGWMFKYDHSILQYLFDGLIDGDGYRNKSGTSILTTVSKTLMEQSCILGTCLGYIMKVDTQAPRSMEYKNRIIKGNYDCFRIYFNTKNVSINGNRDTLVDYDGDIWCLKVEDNANFVVERNGKFKISGNTDEVYGDITVGEHKETDLLKPSSPYSSSKAAADMLILAWSRTYKIPYVIVRPTNNYGIGQYIEKLIPKTCKYLQLGRKIPLHDNGTPVRNWLHAQDTANAIITIINSGVKNEIFNIAGHFEQDNLTTVKKIIECYYNITDINIDDYIEHTKRPGQDLRYAINDDKLCNINWYPQKIFDDELPDIVNYYKQRFIW